MSIDLWRDDIAFGEQHFVLGIKPLFRIESAYNFASRSLRSAQHLANIDGFVRALRRHRGNIPMPIVRGAHPRFLSGDEQFGLRIARRKKYYPKIADMGVIRHPSNLDYLRSSYHKRNVVELFIGNGEKTAAIHRHLISKNIHPHMYYANDLVMGNLKNAERELLNSGLQKGQFVSMQGNVFNAEFWQTTFPQTYKPDPTIGTTFAIYGATVCNHDMVELVELFKHIREHMRPGDNLLVSIDMTRHIETLKLAYNSPVYPHIFLSGLFHQLTVLGVKNFNFDEVDCTIDFEIEFHNRVEMNIVNKVDQMLLREYYRETEVAFLADSIEKMQHEELMVREKFPYAAGTDTIGRMYRLEDKVWAQEAWKPVALEVANDMRWVPENPIFENANHHIVGLKAA